VTECYAEQLLVLPASGLEETKRKEPIMANTKKATALNRLQGANWSLGIITEVKVLNDRVVLKLADGTFRQCVLKTARAVRAMPELSLDVIARTTADMINNPVAFCAASYNGRSWSADQWFIGIVFAEEYLQMRVETTPADMPF